MQKEEHIKPRKFTTLRQEYLDLCGKVPGKKEHLASVHAVVRRIQGRADGTTYVVLPMCDTNVLVLIRHIAKFPTMWWYNCWKHIKFYSDGTITSLMNSFFINNRLLAKHFSFNNETLEVTSDFETQEVNYFDKME